MAKKTSKPKSKWERTDSALVRRHTFASFVEAMAFVTRLAFYAESVDHHPDLQISYRRVTITWTTHDQGGVTRKDVNAAKFTDTLLRG